jgi:hypothetical protein
VIQYTINGHQYSNGYFLANGIYPPWSTLVTSTRNPQDEASKHFAKLQELARKDIERAFGVLQARWHILTVGCWLWEKEDVMAIMKCCIILHKMIVEEQSPNDDFLNNQSSSTEIIPNHHDPTLTHTMANFIQNNQNLHNFVTHAQLQEDLKV